MTVQGNIQREFSALGGLLQQIVADKKSIKMVKRLAVVEKKTLFFNWLGSTSEAFFSPAALKQYFLASDLNPVPLHINEIVTSHAISLGPGDCSPTDRQYKGNFLQLVTEEALAAAEVPGFQGFTEEHIRKSNENLLDIRRDVDALTASSEEGTETVASSDEGTETPRTSCGAITDPIPETEVLETVDQQMVVKEADANVTKTVDDMVLKEAVAKAKMLAGSLRPEDQILICRCIHPKFLRSSLRRQMTDRCQIRTYWKSPTNNFITEQYGIRIHTEDIKSLAPGQCLNSNIINFALNLICQDQSNVLLYNSDLFALLEDGVNRARINEERRRFDGAIHKHVIMPVASSGHWSVIHFDVRYRTVDVYDSFHVRNNLSMEKVQSFFGSLCGAPCVRTSNVEGPRQENGFDGGLFVVYAMLQKIRKVQSHVISNLTSEVLRVKIGNAIVNNRVALF